MTLPPLTPSIPTIFRRGEQEQAAVAPQPSAQALAPRLPSFSSVEPTSESASSPIPSPQSSIPGA